MTRTVSKPDDSAVVAMSESRSKSCSSLDPREVEVGDLQAEADRCAKHPSRIRCPSVASRRAARGSQSACHGGDRRHRRGDRPRAPRPRRAVVLTGRREELLARAAGEPGRARRARPARPGGARRRPRGSPRRRARWTCWWRTRRCPASGRVEDFDPDEIDRALDVNLRAPMQLTRALLPGHARARPRPRGPRLLAVGEGRLAAVGRLLGHQVRPARLRGRAARGRRAERHRRHGGLPRLRERRGLLRRQRREAAALGRDAHARAGRGAVVHGIERGRAELDVAPLACAWARASRSSRRSRPRRIQRRLGSERIADGLPTPSATSAEGRLPSLKIQVPL